MDGRDNLEAVCRDRLEKFRIKELKDVLHRLGLPKQGKKQVLRDKIMAVFAPGERQAVVRTGGRTPGREEAAKIIADIYRKLQGPAAPDLATGRAAASSSARSEEPDNEVLVEKKETRCPCGNASEQENLIQCDDQNCSIWQHLGCVVVPEKAEDASVPMPAQFYCELCRIARGDPFCVSLGNPLSPTKLSGSAPKIEGSHVMQNVERVFRISRSERELITKPNHDLQVWCVLLNDKVPFRMHWPTYADLRINGLQVRVTTRPGQQVLGLNGRDEGPGIASLLKDGDNRLCLWSNDARQFCVGIRIIRRLTMAQVLEKIPDVSTGENIDEALGRVRRAVTGGAAETPDGDEDDDLVVLDSITVNLRCPMSGSRIKTAGRFRPCAHMGCFDLETLVGINQRARKWQCPICLKNFCLEHLIIDPFFNRVASAMRGYSEDITEVEMKADGVWRPKLEGEAGAGEPWRSPEGSIIQSNGVAKNATSQPDFVTVKVEEGLSPRGGLRPPNIRLKRSRVGQWGWNGAKRVNGVTSRNVAGPIPQKPTVITRSTSATASNVNVGNGDDERSVNQEPSDGSGDANGGMRPSAVHTSGLFDTSRSMALAGPNDPGDVIVLSDSDDEDILVHYPVAQAGGGDVGMARRSPEVLSDEIRGEPDLAPDSTGLSLGAIPILQPYRQVNPLSPVGAQLVSSPAGGNSASGFLPLDKNNGFWNGSGHSFVFNSASDTGPANLNQLTQPLRPTPLQAVEGANYGLSSQPNGRSFNVGGVGTVSPIRHSSYDRNFGGENSGRDSPTESPLHIFLPPQPARAVETTLRGPVLPEDDDIHNSWFSLSLGSDMGMEATLPGTTAPAPVPGGTSQARDHLDTLTTTANVLLGMTSRDSPMSAEPMTSLQRSLVHPTQRRSVPNSLRRRYYRIDSDSD